MVVSSIAFSHLAFNLGFSMKLHWFSAVVVFGFVVVVFVSVLFQKS